MKDTERELERLKVKILQLENRIKSLNMNSFTELGGFEEGLFRWIGPVGQSKYRKAMSENKTMREWINREIDSHRDSI